MLSRGRVWPGSCILDSSIAAKSRGRDSRCAVGAIFAFPGFRMYHRLSGTYPLVNVATVLQPGCVTDASKDNLPGHLQLARRKRR